MCVNKETPDELIPKARLLSRVIEETAIEGVQKYSPTYARKSLNIVLQMFCQKEWMPN